MSSYPRTLPNLCAPVVACVLLIDAAHRFAPGLYFLLWQGIFATACLPVLFTLCAMLAAAWINASPAAEADTTADVRDGEWETIGEGGKTNGLYESSGGFSADMGGSGGCYAGDMDGAACGRLRLEELAFAALCRAVRALWGLLLRVLRPEVGDGPAAAVSVISLCSVAFFAVPTFRALEDAERTYQVGAGGGQRRDGKKEGGGSGKQPDGHEERQMTQQRRAHVWKKEADM